VREDEASSDDFQIGIAEELETFVVEGGGHGGVGEWCFCELGLDDWEGRQVCAERKGRVGFVRWN